MRSRRYQTFSFSQHQGACCLLSLNPPMIPFSTMSSPLEKKALTSFLITKPIHHHRHLHSQPSPSPFLIFESTCFDRLYHCNSKSLSQGLCFHSPVIKLGLNRTNLHIANLLLSLYFKCLGLSHARKLFDEMSIRDVVSWTAIVSAYVHSRNNDAALQLFREMLLSGEIPNQFTYSTVIRCVSSAGEFGLGTCAHAQIVKRGFESNVVLASALLDFYSKCGELEGALQVFAQMEHRDTVSWTVMISCLVEAGDWSAAMLLFVSMVASGISPNEFTFVKILMACSFLGLCSGELVHAQLIMRGIGLNLVLKTALVDMYCKCVRMEEAFNVFHQTAESDVMLWTVMVFGYAQAGYCEEAIATFRAMDLAGILPNSLTFVAVLNACASALMLVLGMQIHSRIAKVGLGDMSVGNALVNLYAKLSPSFDDHVRAFGELHSPDAFSWTALIAGLARHEQVREAFAAFTEMRAVGVEPDSYTLSTILKCCHSSTEAVTHVMRIHAYILKTNVDAWDVQLIIGNSLVDAYARMRRIDDAWNVSSTMMAWRDLFTYTNLAKGLNQMGLHRKALDIITPMMHVEDVKMDGFSLATFISATAGLAAIQLGKQLHCYSVKSGLNGWISVSNGLIDMYSKCGSIKEARNAFLAIPEPNVVSWNGLILGLASNGYFSDALSAFEDMRMAEAQPDGITMLVILYACSHGGLVDFGVEYFNSMRERFGVTPQLDHYVCLVDLLGRAGRLEEAACAIETMGFKPKDPVIYKTLLNCCKLHGNLVMGECMARQALEIDPLDPTVYVMLAGIYDDAGKVEMGEQTRKMMRERGLNKYPGQSLVESRNL